MMIALVAAYLVGGIPFGYLLVRWKTGEDVREKGSGNIGATNVLRTTGRDGGGDAFARYREGRVRGVAGGQAFRWLALWMSLAALAVMAGHAFPVFLKFQGGKAVASFIGAFLYLTPIPMIAALVVFVIVVAATRQISMGSIVAAGSLAARGLADRTSSVDRDFGDAGGGRVCDLPASGQYRSDPIGDRKRFPVR
jgi:glycerol-3-phosphate acyltransferase PlsY